MSDQNPFQDSQHKFWDSFADELENKYANKDCDSVVDLRTMQLVQQSTPRRVKPKSKPPVPATVPAITHPSNSNSNNNPSQNQRLQCEALQALLENITKSRNYGPFLCDLIKNQLIDHLGDTIFKLFLVDKVPINFIPLIKINKKNSPSVEFLVKNTNSDDDYLKQLGCSTRQIELSNEILQEVKDYCFNELEPQRKEVTNAITCNRTSRTQIQQIQHMHPIRTKPALTNGISPKRSSPPINRQQVETKKAKSAGPSRRNPNRSCRMDTTFEL